MPELPEVETVKRGLNSLLEDKPIIVKLEFTRKNLRDPMPIKKLKTLEGERLVGVDRRAKYLLMWAESGGFLSHLGMTGTWRLCGKGEERDHDHIYIHFKDGRKLAYRDPRRFGVFDYLSKEQVHPKLAVLGPEPLENEFTGKVLWQALRGKSQALKVAIMDQKVVVGVGNIYASEALYLAGVKPQMPASRLSLVKSDELVSEIKKILTRSIELGGSSISDFKATDGGQGYFQNTFHVYGREGESCSRCTSLIKAEVLGGRNTFWCKRCQR